MNSDQRQTLELIRSDYPDAKIMDKFEDDALDIEDKASGETWIVDQLGEITMHNGEWL